MGIRPDPVANAVSATRFAPRSAAIRSAVVTVCPTTAGDDW
jgi:hypothetical protein